MAKGKLFSIIHSIITVSLLVIIMFMTFANKSEKPDITCVPTSAEAVSIGKAICTAAYPELNLEQYKLEYLDNGDTWIVFYYEDGVLGGGLPEVHIRKDNAQVTFISLMA